jgi:tetratricopeptide (TPR) repeat protein
MNSAWIKFGVLRNCLLKSELAIFAFLSGTMIAKNRLLEKKQNQKERREAMKRFEKTLAVLLFLLIALAFIPTSGFGQGRGKGKEKRAEYPPRVEQKKEDRMERKEDDRRRDDYKTERRKDEDDRFTRGEILSTITRLQNRSREFERRLNREFEKMDRRSFGDFWSKREYVLSLARDFRRATDRLEDRYRATRSLDRTYYDAQEVLRLGQELENALRTYDLSNHLEKDWNRIREDLNRLANIYAQRNDDRGHRNRGNRGYPKVPIPFPF